ncbi:MAG: hypothetical protein ACYCTF_05845 [Acidiferrobacter sp.]
MSRNTLFIEDVYGKGWENELGDEARIEPRAEVVRGLTAARYQQLWKLFPNEKNTDVLFCLGQGFDVERTASMTGLSQRQVKNSISIFLSMARAAFSQPSFLPPPRPVAGSLYIERRPRSRRGRPPKDRKSPPTTTSMQVPLPF